MTGNELSDLTHEFHMWQAGESRILAREKQVPMNEEDLDEDDMGILRWLKEAYPDDMIRDSVILSVKDKMLVFSKEDAARLTKQNHAELDALADESLVNPVFACLDEGVVSLEVCTG